MKAPIGFLFFAKAFIPLSEAGVFSASVVIYTVSSWVGNQLCRTQTLEHTHKFIYIRTYIQPWTHRGSGRLSDLLLWNQRAASAINWQSSTPCCLCNGDRKNTHIVKHCGNTNIHWEERREKGRRGEARMRGEERIRKEREGEERIGEVFFLVLKGEERERPGGEGRRGVWCDTVWLRAMKSEWVYGEIKGLRNKGEKAWADRYRVHKVQEPAGATADSNTWALLIGIIRNQHSEGWNDQYVQQC